MTEKSRLVAANEKAAETVTNAFSKIEKTVVNGYETVEKTVVGGYTKIEDAFVDRYLKQDGETLEQAKARLKAAHPDRPNK